MASLEAVRMTLQHKYVVLGSELFVTVFLVAYNFGIATLPSLPINSFFERDLAISHPLVDETISTSKLVGISFGLPLLMMMAIVGIYSLLSRENWQKIVVSVFFAGLVVCQAHLIAGSIQHTFKVTFGKLRPNFFAYCNYAGYRDALSTGNYTDYLAATTEGAFGDMSKCLAASSDIRSSTASFPSGHASTAFAGLLVLALFLRSMLSVSKSLHLTFGAFVCCLPLMLASYIALSRFRDRYHFTDDVLGGSLIGIGGAIVAWWHHEKSARDVFDIARKQKDEAAASADKLGMGSPMSPISAIPMDNRPRNASPAPYTAGPGPVAQPSMYGGRGRGVPSMYNGPPPPASPYRYSNSSTMPSRSSPRYNSGPIGMV